MKCAERVKPTRVAHWMNPDPLPAAHYAPFSFGTPLFVGHVTRSLNLVQTVNRLMVWSSQPAGGAKKPVQSTPVPSSSLTFQTTSHANVKGSMRQNKNIQPTKKKYTRKTTEFESVSRFSWVGDLRSVDSRPYRVSIAEKQKSSVKVKTKNESQKSRKKMNSQNTQDFRNKCEYSSRGEYIKVHS